MCEKKLLYSCLLIMLMGTALLFLPGVEPSHVHAQDITPVADHGTCIKCHENLYFLYDTGNWFCIRESPMRCVDCHGGNPSSLKKEEAHTAREDHPIINEDISKCQECHPAECPERVVKFDQVAGISDVLVAVPYQPKPNIISEQSSELQPVEKDKHPGWISAMEIITLFLITGLAIIVYFIHRHIDHKQKRSNR